MLRHFGLILCCASLLAACGEGFSAYPAPPIEAPWLAADGSFNLKSQLTNDDRPILLNLWASWCGPCREEMPALDQAAAANPEIAFVGIAVLDREEEAREFLDEVPVRFPNALDRSGDVAERLGVIGLPVTLIVVDGDIVAEYRGPLDLDKIDDLLP